MYLFVRPRDLCFIQASQLEKLLPAVLPQFHQGLFSKEKKGSEEAKQRWLDAVKQATTVSRLHLLLEIMDSTVIWDLSAENAVCMRLEQCYTPTGFVRVMENLGSHGIL